MQWFDIPRALDSHPGGVLELASELTPAGLALELHVYARPEGTRALWVLEDGRVLGEVVVGRA